MVVASESRADDVERFLSDCEEDFGIADEIQSFSPIRQMTTLLRFLGDDPAETLGHVLDSLKVDFEHLLDQFKPQECEIILRIAQPCLLYPQLRYLPNLVLRRLNKVPEDILQFIASHKIEESLPLQVRQQVFEVCETNFIVSVDVDCRALIQNIKNQDTLDKLYNKIKNSKKLFGVLCKYCGDNLIASRNNMWAEIALQLVLYCYSVHDHTHSSLAFISPDVLLAARTLSHAQKTKEFFTDCSTLCSIMRKLLQVELRKEQAKFEHDMNDYEEWLDAQPKKKPRVVAKSKNHREEENDIEPTRQESERKVERKKEKEKEKASLSEGAVDKKTPKKEREKELKTEESIPAPVRPSLSRDEIEALSKSFVNTVVFLKKQDPHKIFWSSVSDKVAPGYSTRINRPMWFSLVEERAKKKSHYQCEEDFNEAVQTIFQNCETYNGKDSPYSVYGRVIESRWKRRRGVLDYKSSSICCPLAVIVDTWNIAKTLDICALFLDSPAELPGYKALIEQPMDLTTIKQRIDNDKANFQLVDLDANVQLMLENCVVFNLINDPEFYFVKYAEKMLIMWRKVVAFHKAWAAEKKRDMARFVAKGAESEAMELLDLPPLDSPGENRAALLKKVLSLLVSLIRAIEKQHKEDDKLPEFLSAVKSLRKKVESGQFKDLEGFVEEVKRCLEGAEYYYLDISTDISLSVYIACALMTLVVAAKYPFLSRNKARTSETPRVREIAVAAAPESESKPSQPAPEAAAAEQPPAMQQEVVMKKESDSGRELEQSPVLKIRLKPETKKSSEKPSDTTASADKPLQSDGSTLVFKLKRRREEREESDDDDLEADNTRDTKTKKLNEDAEREADKRKDEEQQRIDQQREREERDRKQLEEQAKLEAERQLKEQREKEELDRVQREQQEQQKKEKEQEDKEQEKNKQEENELHQKDPEQEKEKQQEKQQGQKKEQQEGNGPTLVFKIKKRKLVESDNDDIEDGEERDTKTKKSNEVAEREVNKRKDEEEQLERKKKADEEEQQREREERDRKQLEEQTKLEAERQLKEQREREEAEQRKRQEELEELERVRREQQEQQEKKDKEHQQQKEREEKEKEQQEPQKNEMQQDMLEKEKVQKQEQQQEKEKEKEQQQQQQQQPDVAVAAQLVDERVRPEPSPQLLALKKFCGQVSQDYAEFPALSDLSGNVAVQQLLLLCRAPSFQRSLSLFVAKFVVEQIKSLRESPSLSAEAVQSLKDAGDSDEAVSLSQDMLFTRSRKLLFLLQLVQLRFSSSLAAIPSVDESLARDLLPELCTSLSEDPTTLKGRLSASLERIDQYDVNEVEAWIMETIGEMAKHMGNLFD